MTLFHLISDILHRCSVITKEILPTIQAFDLNSQTLLTKNLHRVRLEIMVWN